jgi:SAM-dependent methyltransferase
VVICKILPSQDPQRFPRLSRQLLEQAAAASAAGVRVLADFNDDHFDRPGVAEHWRSLARAVTACVAGTTTMAQLVRRHTPAPVVVVGDPVAAPLGSPRVFQAPTGAGRWVRGLLGGAGSPPRLKLVWYGHPVNWRAMQAWSRVIEPLSREQPYLIWVVTQPSAAIEADIEAHNRRCGPAGLMELVPWDEETQWATVADSDVVLIPSDPADPKKAVKTSNRLTDALHAGRAVIASPLPAYQDFAGQAVLTDAPLEALRELLAHPARTLERLRAGQQAVIERCGLEAIARQWAEACAGVLPETALDVAPKRDASFAGITPEPAPVRLNLGCGDKILPGFVNVDVVEARAGQRPDVICDLHQLHPFADDSADEVMAIHVVEHFWRWEVEEVLREWLRVLKPGGRMVLECPNLLSAARELLADPEQRARADQAGQRSMWVFYGDPGWKDPLMIHRWGYTPASLAELMRQVGLVNVRQEPAQYKLREPRDMRLVGDKPG